MGAVPDMDPAGFCRIHVDDFLSTSYLISDIYVRLPSNKMVMVAREGEEIPLERLKTYRERKVEFIYVTAGAYSQYVNFSVRVALAARKARNIPNEKKIRLLKSTTETIVGRCFLEPIDSAALEAAQMMIEDTLKLLSDDDRLMDILLSMESGANRLYAHCTAVSLYSCLVAKKHGWHSTATLFKVAMSGLFHDIGLKGIPDDVIYKQDHLRTNDEKTIYMSHVQRGHEVLGQIDNLPEGVLQVVRQHHESVIGTGYPNGLRGEQIIPLARLIGLVDRFCDLVFPIEDGVEALSAPEALRRIKLRQNGQVDAKFFASLCDLFRVDGDKII